MFKKISGVGTCWRKLKYEIHILDNFGLVRSFDLSKNYITARGVSRIFERGGPISLGSLKKRSSDFKRGGVQWSEGGVQYICLTMTTNLAYLDAKE